MYVKKNINDFTKTCDVILLWDNVRVQCIFKESFKHNGAVVVGLKLSCAIYVRKKSVSEVQKSCVQKYK